MSVYRQGTLNKMFITKSKMKVSLYLFFFFIADRYQSDCDVSQTSGKKNVHRMNKRELLFYWMI